VVVDGEEIPEATRVHVAILSFLLVNGRA